MTEDPRAATTLEARKRQLLSLMMKEKGVDPLHTPILPQPRDRDGYVLSFAQERLWLIDQIEPGNIAYNVPTALRVRGTLKPAVAIASFTEVARRHQTLRTTFGSIGGRPVQRISPTAPVPVPVMDLSALPADRQEPESRRLVVEESGLPFDLTAGVLRVRLVRLAPEDHILLFTLHHISSDGWSNGVLAREMVQVYQAFAAGQPSPLAELPVQYVDFAHWQRQTLRGPVLDRMLEYWRGQLAGVPVLELPTDRPRPPVPSLDGGLEAIEVPGEVWIGLRELGRAETATSFMLIGALYLTLLSRYSGQTDLSFGTPVANRHRTEVEPLIGFFVNTLVVRADLAGDPTFRELLRRVRKLSTDAFANQEVPFSKLVEVLNPERSLAHTPLFQVLFGMGNAPASRERLSGLSFDPLEDRTQTSMFELNLSAGTGDGSGLGYSFEYRTELWDAPSIHRMLAHLVNLTAGAVAAPDRRISELPLLSAPEIHQLEAEWNDTAASAAPLIDERLTGWEGRDGTALAFEDRSLTWRELDAAANRLAHRLRRLGAGPGTRLGFCAGRSLEMVVGFLAVLRTGAAYVPLDPAYPVERLAWMLADADAPILVTQERLLALFPDFPGERVLLDHALDTADGEGPAALPVEASRDDLLYVIYTSGSTGRPKGVGMTRGVLSNLIAWQERVTPGPARTLQFTSLSFDVSAQEILACWAAGGTLVLVSEETRRDPHALLALLERERIERLFLPFVALRQLAEAAESEGWARDLALCDVITAGEQLQLTRAVVAWFERLAGCRLHNQYGPTETHVITALTLPAGEAARWAEDWTSLPPIGRPTADALLAILDDHLQRVPIGVHGELCLGGQTPARGYLGRPELTAERFTPDPWGAPGARLYRTGDRARWRPDGTVDFLGRRDLQVKVRGIRVEPGEVEAALAAHPAVLQAAVVARPEVGAEAGAGSLRLVAYYVPDPACDSEAAPDAAALRAFLAGRLPAAFVPSAFVELAAFPLTPSGKVDRRSLPAPEGTRLASEESYVAPRTPAEERLAEVWGALLGLDRVGVEDNFFELGGHSLLATQVVTRVREALGVEIPQRALFEAPTVAGLARRIDQAAAGPEPAAAADRIAGRAVGPGPYPQSFSQERLWLIEQIDPGNVAYNLPVALRLAGRLRPAALAAALTEIARRHATQRTTYGVVDGRPVQLVAPPAPVPLPLADLGALPPGLAETEARRLATQEALTPFDLERGPVLRARLLRLPEADGTEQHGLLFTQHHIASDGWSTGILVREVMALYEAFSQGEPSPLPDLPARYVDYAVWQRETLSGEALEAELGYWRRQLSPPPPVLALPTDRPRPPRLTSAGSTEVRPLPADLAAGLHALAQRENATLFMVVLAAFQAQLARYSGQTDLAVGTPVAGRDRAELEELIGFFVNTLVLRADLSGNPDFRDLLGRVRRVALDAFARQRIPFERLVEELAPERSLSHTPLFQVLCALQNAPTHALEIPGLAFLPLEAEGGAAKFDLSLSFAEIPDSEVGLVASMEYRTDLFDAATIDRLLGHTETLLRGIVERPGRELSELPLLDASERLQVLRDWADGPPVAWPDRCLHELVEERAAADPDALALLSRAEQVSYGEMDRRADRLARRLVALGVAPQDRVGVCLERSPALIVGLLAVLKAGASYVPLDPAYPPGRLEVIAEDAGLAAVLVEAPTAGRLPASLALRAVDVDAPEDVPETVRLPRVPPDATAYVLYTSGSTGRPKGVVVPHRAAANLALASVGLFDLKPGDRYLQLVSVSFDGSVLDIFATLAAGACLAVADRGPLPVGEDLASLFLDLQVTLTVASLSVISTAGDPARFPALTVLGTGGEKCTAEFVRRWAPGRKFLNVYGPTEATVFATTWECPPGYRSAAAPPIGRPIANLRARILDAAGQPAPTGVTGELCLGGAGIARGYHGRPDLTAAAFVPDPFAAEPGERLYRTGDLARFRPDGDIDILDRLDEQVKVRGVRIETGEVETALLAHPAIAAAAVQVEKNATGGRLLAFVVPAGGRDTEIPAAADLRAFLRERLPEAYLPSRVLPLAAIPVTQNGKVDRDALARLAAEMEEAAGPDGAGAAPRTATEETLASIWAGLLGRERVGIHDDFFDLGGHSLLATQLVSRIRQAFSVELPQRALFESPTVAGLAEQVEALRGGGSSLVPPLDPIALGADGDDGLPRLSFAQERLWILDQVEPGGNSYNIPLALRLAGDLDVPALAAALTALVERHETLRTAFSTVLENGEATPVQVIQPAVAVPLPLADLSALPQERRESEVHALAQISGGRPFDLAADLMLRGLLVRLTAGDPGRHALFLTVHHIASDGWSGGVLVREMVALYEAFSHGRPSPLPPLPIRYVDYARWQRRALQGEALERALGYWRHQLAGVPVLDLPADRPRPPVPLPGGDTVPLELSREVSEALAALGRREGATLFMVVMAAFQTLMSRISPLGRQADVPVGTPVAGRRRVELEGLIGFFVNTLVIRGDLSGDPPFTGLLARVRTAALDAFAHQDIPFERLVEEINPERSFAHTPLFQVMCVLQNAPGGALEVPGLAFEPESAGQITAKFDLTLILTETPEGLAGSLEYRPDLFDRTTAVRLLEHFGILLAGIAEDPARPLSELPLLSAAELQVLREWNDNAMPVPAWSLEERLAERAAATPDAPAVVGPDGDGRVFSYAKMHAAAGRLAVRLRGIGVAPEVRVGILAERTPEMVAAVLAVTRSGGAYVPIDPAYPADRVALMLSDSGATVLLTQERLLGKLPPFPGQVVLLDGLMEESPEPVAGLPVPAADPDQLLYIVYTSGSTGRPKGIAMFRRALINLLAWQTGDPLARPARTLQFSSLSFDASVQEIFGTWITGGTLVLVTEETRLDPHALLARIDAQRAERAHLPVVALRQIAEAVAAQGGGGTFYDIVAAGEQLQVTPLITGWLGRVPGARLHNHYGPSETHAITSWILDSAVTDPAQWPVLVPLGRALPNHRIDILDAHLRPLPVGSVGELCVAGVQLSRGYVGRPDLTAELFVPDPAGEAGSRMYRTGDLARWRSDGLLEFLGRRDGQVKVRGVRIEISEVEAALDHLPGVRQSAVLATPGPDGALRLIAWYLAEPGSGVTPADLRDALRAQLPGQYVPSFFVPLDEFPLTPSGKVDRRALGRLEPEAAEGAADDRHAPPRTQTEELLAGVWAALLDVPRVGRHDSFFDLGGHSLLATRLVSRVRRVFGIELPQRALFEAPTVAELALRVEEALQSAVAGVAGIALPPIEPLVSEGGGGRPARLSFAQERLWLLGQVDPESPSYNLPVALRIGGRLDPAVLAAAFAEVVRRHATLRTTYGVAEGDRRPVQIVAPAGPVPLPLLDLAGVPEGLRDAEVERLADEEANRPFDLARGPVLRLRLIRLGAAEHALLLNVHHIASDGWSNSILVREVTELYAAAEKGHPAPLPELPIQYADYARWQRRVLRGEALEATLAYWRGRLAGVPVLELPSDRPRPAVQGAAGAQEPAELSGEATAGLQALGRREGATLFMGFLALWQALLHRYSGQADFAVGTPVAGRDRVETEGLIGFFVNTLVLRADLSGDPPFAELLGRVRQTALEAFAHQEVPFEKLVEELNPERSLAHTPLFQALAALQNTPSAALDVADLTFTPIAAAVHTAKFDLSISVTEIPGPAGLAGAIEYRTELFDAASVRRLAGHLATLLDSALAEPGRPVSELPLMSAAERREIVVEWNRTVRPGLGAGLLHELFEAQARALPDAPAIWSAGTTVSYRELDERADGLAQRLRARGVGPEVLVGACQDRSVEMIVAVLGILKAGGAYVPFDPSYPAERLAFMAEDAGIRTIVVNVRTANQTPKTAETVLVEEAGEGAPLSRQGGSVAGRGDGGEGGHLAYVIYTSGSTGRPKGVAVPHRGIVNTIRASIEAWRLGPGERYLQFASFSFDGSVAEIFSALGSGACLCLIGRAALPSGEVLAAALREPRVTVAIIPPSVLATLGEERFPDLRTLNVSAEKCPVEMVRQWAPGRRFLNIYGPTEASVYMTLWEAGEGAQDYAAPPIGRPIANSRVYVLDHAGAPVPVGIPGELYLGGVCLTRGYIGRPEKTAESFVPDPFAADWDEAGGRLYRTGDLCRFRPDGDLEILGRIDHQVKVRGFRIELGEIESVLVDHPAVRRAAVLSRPGPGGARLVAYVVPDPAVAGAVGDGDPLAPVLRSHLRDRLPDFMVPAAFVELAALPLTASGKLDRAALPDPGGERPDLATSYVAPAGDLESALAEIWKEILNVERVGIDDSFFDLGGHSLLLVELQGRIRERLGREVPLLDLFRYPTISTLAKFLRPATTTSGAEGAGEIQTRAVQAAVREAVRPGSRDIAVIGMAARFPQSPDLETFWAHLREGRELITFFTPEELAAEGYPRELIEDPGYVPANGVLEDPDLFDAGLFDIGPREAQLMDPQQRVLLECATEALERAGYGPGSPALLGELEAAGARPRVGVYAGGGMSSYGLQNLFGRPVGGSLEVVLGNDKDFLATRVAYKLNLRGPAFTVQTACSTSLVAIHVACQGLLDGECEMALAGGITIQFPMRGGYFYEEGGVLSRDGHTRAFDAQGRGTVSSNGVGLVLLKPLDRALADGDPVHAVIKGTAINNDGSEKIGFTAPSEEGQAEVIVTAQALGGVEPATLGYIEAHGTATPIGDPIEVAALTRAFRARGAGETGFCALGSVKTNLGHAGSAAGVAGFLKAALAVERGEIPPSLHFEHPNPVLDLAGSPFFVNRDLLPWPGEGRPRRAGVSSFGLGGTNAHAVLEQAPAPSPSGPSRGWQLLCLSARTETALEAATEGLIRALKRLPDGPEALADAAYTLQTGRRGWEHRRMVVCRDRADALQALESRDPRRVLGSTLQRGGVSGRPVAFVFSGLGEQYPGMAAGLYHGENAEPAFREAFDRCAAILEPLLGTDLRALLFPAGAAVDEEGGGTDLRRLLGRAPAAGNAALGALDRTAVLQPALFAVEYALARLWMSWGVVPQAMIGYSLGEYVAACLSGVLSLPDALRLVAERARLIDALPEGAMLAISLPESEVEALLAEYPELSLAAVNGPALTVVAGAIAAVTELEALLGESGVACRRLRTTHAFHSALLAPAAEPLARFVEGLALHPPRIPYVSNVTGTWITAPQATDPRYWADHLVRPVRFSEGIGELWREPGRVLLEIGPGGSLATLALQHPAAGEGSDPVAVATLRSAYERRSDPAFLLGTLGKLWLAGTKVGWRNFYAGERRRRVELPAYPFERQRYWIEAAAPEALGPSAAPGLHAPSWSRSAPLAAPAREDLAAGRWLLFAPAAGFRLGEGLAGRLREAGARVATVLPGGAFQQPAAGSYRLDPGRAEDYDALLGALLQEWGAPPDRIVHLWTLGEAGPFLESQDRGFYSLLFLTQSLGRWQMASGAAPEPVRALVVSSGLYPVRGSDALRFENAPLAALCRSLSLEVDGVVCRPVDVTGRADRLIEDLLAEALAGSGPAGEAVAYRNGSRWVRTYAPVPAPPAAERGTALRPGGVLVLAGRPDPLLAGAAAAVAAQAGGALATAGFEDAAELAAALDRIEAANGPIEGIIVADVAGTEPPPLPAAFVTRETSQALLAETARRLSALAAALEGREPAFCLLVSSLAPVVVEPGKALQGVVDAMSDAFAGRSGGGGETPWTAVSWDTAAGIDPAAAAEALRRILTQAPVPQVVVSWEDLGRRLRRAVEPDAEGPAPEAGPSPGQTGITLHARPNLRNPYVEPATGLERAVVDMWQGILGIETVGIHDSFFDLGGDSLLATQVFNRIREAYEVDIQLGNFFEQPTPAALAAFIEAGRPTEGETDADKMARIMDTLDSLSPEDIERMLAERGTLEE